MRVVVYLDVFFAVNLVMDGLLLALVRRMLGLRGGKKAWLRLAGGAAFGAASACAGLLLPFPSSGIWRAAACLITGGGMAAAAFGWQGRAMLAREMGALWLVSAAAGGLCMAVGESMPAGWEGWLYLAQSRAGRQWSLTWMGLTAAGIYGAGRVLLPLLGRWTGMGSCLCQVRLLYRGRSKLVVALRDSGNRLYEPYGNRPVHVITREGLSGLCDHVSGVIYIPFSSVGREKGVLPGICLDRMEILTEGRVSQVYERPWVAVVSRPLSPERRYDMLLHGETAGMFDKNHQKIRNLEDQ